MTDPRGLRDNNPGNLEIGGPVFLGQVEPPDGVYLRFADPVSGLRAIIKRLQAYQLEDGCVTVREMISRWAPPEDNNPTEQYIANVASALGFTPDQANTVPVDLGNVANLEALLKAITTQEQGEQPYSQFTIDRAIAMVLTNGQAA